MIVSKRTEITQADLASAIDKVQDEERRSGAKVPSRGGFGFNPRGNNSNDNNSPSSSQRGGRGRGGDRGGERGGLGGRGGASGPPLPKIPDFILKGNSTSSSSLPVVSILIPIHTPKKAICHNPTELTNALTAREEKKKQQQK